MRPRKIVSAGGVVVGKNGKIVVVNQSGTSWSLPKGHVEEGEDFLTAAKREIMEESGIKELRLIKQLPSYERFRIGRDGGNDTTELKTIHMFLFTTSQTELSPRDPQNPEAKWVSPEDVSNLLTHEKDREFFQKIAYELKNVNEGSRA